MRLVSGIKKPETRAAAIEAFQAGKSPEAVKALVKSDKPSDDPKFRLDKERERLERTIHTLQERLTMIESELAKLDEE